MSLSQGMVLQARYRILRALGSGGMGDVYLAEDTRLTGRFCAIKAMSPAALPPDDRNWAITAFRQEAQLLATLRHRGLTQVADFFAEGGTWYLVMEYVEGITLEDRLQHAPGRRLAVQEALTIIYQLCDVLDYLHRQNPPVIFRDLKPANVMLTSQNDVKLIDFGIARFFKTGKAQDTVNLGTPGYAAPEQHGHGGQTDARSDVYSLGVLLHQILTGHDPTTTIFSLPSAQVLNPAIPPAGEAVIVRATQMDPALRFQTVQEFRQALFLATPTPTTQMSAPLPYTATTPVSTSPTTAQYPVVPPLPPHVSPQPIASSAPPSSTSTSNKWLWAGLVVLAVTCLALAAALLLRPSFGDSGLTVTPLALEDAPASTATLVVLSAADASDDPVTSTPQPASSPLPPTATPRPANTLRPTSTPRPTVPPPPTATPAPLCPGVSGPFADLGTQLQSRLGCVQGSAYATNAAEELFQSGRMYWREDDDRIYALYNNGQWEVHRDTWNEGDPDYSCGTAATPPTPVRGFGRAWCNFASIRNGLGNATEGERGLGITVQQFDNGVIVRTDNRTLVLYNDQTWERR
jgi:serine/threonine protein kinase